MFGRTHGVTTKRFTDAAGSVIGYVDPLVHDEKLRQRIAAAVTAGMAAGRQAQKQKGLRGAVSRLATDQVLRAQIAEAAAQLRAAADRAEKARRHRFRNTVLFLTGIGLVAVAFKAKLGSSDDWSPAEPDVPNAPLT